MRFEWHPTQARGTVQSTVFEPADDGVTIGFDLLQPDDLGTVHITMAETVPGSAKVQDGQQVVVHWTSYLREQVEVVRSP